MKNDVNQFDHVVIKSERLYTYLKDVLMLSLRQTNAFIKSQSLLVNSKVVSKNLNLNKGDVITLLFMDESNEYEPEDIPLDILYESDDLLIINKPPQVLVHPTPNYPHHTIANAVSFYYYSLNLKRKIRFVNRLDRDTSGILVIAKNAYSHGFLAKQFESDLISKKYLAIVSGTLPNASGEISINIQKSDDIKYLAGDEGLPSKTLYRVLKTGDYSLVECELKSGRTHQIRLSLASLGVYILGDSLYHEKSAIISRQALHAYKLTFIEPRTFLKQEIVCETPEDMKKLIF